MITYTLIDNDYIVKREGNTSVTFNESAADLWEAFEKWVEDGNTPTPAQDDPFLAEQSTPMVTDAPKS